jgi:hypothetical protein
MKRITTSLMLGMILSLPLWGAEILSDAEIQKTLARVPETDPKPTAVPPMLASMKGVHPRLLFSPSEIEDLKTRIAGDPVLKKTYADWAAWARKFPYKTWTAKGIVNDDTQALTMFDQLPVLAYVYALDKDPEVKLAILDVLNKLLEEPYWTNTAELDSKMGTGNIMIMVGLFFDVVYNDMDPEFRAKMGAKIFTHVRRMYYLGYKQMSSLPIKYWQQDGANNHRWHRGAGMSACLLAISDMEQLDLGYQLEQHKAEMDFLMKWYPPDGDCHEGAGYQTFGFSYLALKAMMMDRVMGTEYLKHPGFQNAWAQQLYYGAPGRASAISFGDDQNNEGAFKNTDSGFFLSSHLSRNKDIQALLVRRLDKRVKWWPNKWPYMYPWLLLSFYDPALGGGDYKAVPLNRLFPDLGAASMRDSWEDDAVCFTFKCGPYGGYKLNEFAMENKDAQGNPKYINVAHDDPDANSFALGMDGDFIFHPGLYSLNKMTKRHSTITVDDWGQVGDRFEYMQPPPGVDARTLSYLTGWKIGAGGRVIIEGEAAKAYMLPRPEFRAMSATDLYNQDPVKAYQPGLKQFRRTAAWMPGEYILILDDIRGEGTHKITWRGTVEKGQSESPESGRFYAYTKKGKRVDFQMLASKELKGAIDFMFMDGRWGSMVAQQFQFFLDSDTVKFACVMDPWKKNLASSLVEKGDVLIVSIKGDGINDTWTWTPPKDARTPSSLVGMRDGREVMALTEKDTAPTE